MIKGATHIPTNYLKVPEFHEALLCGELVKILPLLMVTVGPQGYL